MLCYVMLVLCDVGWGGLEGYVDVGVGWGVFVVTLCYVI